MVFQRLTIVIAVFFALVAVRSGVAQESHSKALAKYMSDDVVGVVYFDLGQFDPEATIQFATTFGFRELSELKELTKILPALKAGMAEFENAGMSRAYALLRSTDIESLGTSWVIPLENGSDPVKAKKVFSEIVTAIQPYLFAEVETTEDAVLAAATKKQMDSLRKADSENSKARQAMWDVLGNGSIGFMLFGDEDSRRVIRELMPTLPMPFESITGAWVADDLVWGGIELSLVKKPKLTFAIEAVSEKAANMVEQRLADGYAFLKQLAQARQYIPEGEFGFVFDGLRPQREGNRVSVTTEKLTADMGRLSDVLAPQVKRVRAEAARIQKLNDLRQLVLSNHNFADVYKRFPTQATVDESGKPLLSWRVQILPFIEHRKLYKQFNLNEPWDSEHNLKLVKQMPEIFADTNPEGTGNNKQGKTIYLGAAGEGMMFNGAETIGFQDIKDGSSNTILFVTVARDHAVPWTQPTDWQINLKNPTAQLQEPNRSEIEIALVDGSVISLPISTDLTTWQRLVQIADGATVEVPR